MRCDGVRIEGDGFFEGGFGIVEALLVRQIPAPGELDIELLRCDRQGLL
jgi:hypothetical protein